jgi:hypothetical protein
MTTTEQDIEALSLRFARLQIEHDQRPHDEAIKRSREAIRAWGECVPPELADVTKDR